MIARRFLPSRAGISVLVLALFASSCRDVNEPTAPSVLMARAASTGPTVSSVVPDSSERGTTLDITVNGSGFDKGSTVKFERQGVPASGITVNSTSYVTSRKLVANVTIAADADVGKYDVAVITPNDRKGIGVEMFTVSYEIAELGILGGTWSRAHAINNNGEVVGASCTNDCLSTAFYWSEASGQVDLGRLPGYTRSVASAINNRSTVFGSMECYAGDAGCGGVYAQQLVRWDRVDGSWTITPVTGCSVVRPLGDQSAKFVINNNDECVRRTSDGVLVFQRLSGAVAVDEAYLPHLLPGGLSVAYGISDASMVAGWSKDENQHNAPVVWYRDATGTWTTLRLTFLATDKRGMALDISEPDGSGRVRVSGFTEEIDPRCCTSHPVRWTLEGDGAGGWRVAATEALPPAGSGQSTSGWAVAVNTSGDVAGNSGPYMDSSNPVKWAVSGGVETLPNSTGGAQGRAVAINDQGWIVGAVWDSKNNCDRAAIWRQR
ncbi:MAG TPA: IPT/TIG domain-containing protein [Gemmatimonadaceae bacterium]|jgi:probable HAF family extracellular repeat protein|nr:IPT/TIG domain-containing protein [Gemmatimonadaceae bacterium]